MKELSSSNHPTNSSTNIETQIPPVNLSQSKKDSSKSDHSTHSPTKRKQMKIEASSIKTQEIL